eukprot:TRINITY_DN2952_c1_g1_i1.p1 TRINITY_DN2952_c1_g1~~TRINITY_DN2952_c1_g1_i1.p1  ORF type:complete len:283 (+),score=63.08 TRINITY_DN2952_c1_g1_i1:581-1429(+)
MDLKNILLFIFVICFIIFYVIYLTILVKRKRKEMKKNLSEDESLKEGFPRVKYETKRIGSVDGFLEKINNVEELKGLCSQLSEYLFLFEKYKLAPILADEKVGGNGGVLFTPKYKDKNNGLPERLLIVSKSGKEPYKPLKLDEGDFVIVRDFDFNRWSACYYSKDITQKPTSDCPLIELSLRTEIKSWNKETPIICLHGHLINNEKQAEELNIPISKTETMCSTREDYNELKILLNDYPFPKNQLYIRKHHGFWLLADSFEKTSNVLENTIIPYVSDKKKEI